MKSLNQKISYKKGFLRNIYQRIITFFFKIREYSFYKLQLKNFLNYIIKNYILPFFVLILIGLVYYIITGYSREYFTSDQILHDIKISLKNPNQDFRFYNVDLKGFGEKGLVVVTGINNRSNYDESYTDDQILIPQRDSPAIYIFSRIQKNFFENLIFPEAMYRKEAQIDLIIDSKKYLNEQKEKLLKDIHTISESGANITDDMLIARSVNEIDLFNPDILKINNSQEGMILTFGDIRYWFSTIPQYYGLLYYDYSLEEYVLKPVISDYDNIQNIKLLCPYVVFSEKQQKKKCDENGYEFKIFDTESFHFMYNGNERIYKLTEADSDTDINIIGGVLDYGYNIWLFTGECHNCEEKRLRKKFLWNSRDLEFYSGDNQFSIK